MQKIRALLTLNDQWTSKAIQHNLIGIQCININLMRNTQHNFLFFFFFQNLMTSNAKVKSWHV